MSTTLLSSVYRWKTIITVCVFVWLVGWLVGKLYVLCLVGFRRPCLTSYLWLADFDSFCLIYFLLYVLVSTVFGLIHFVVAYLAGFNSSGLIHCLFVCLAVLDILFDSLFFKFWLLSTVFFESFLVSTAGCKIAWFFRRLACSSFRVNNNNKKNSRLFDFFQSLFEAKAVKWLPAILADASHPLNEELMALDSVRNSSNLLLRVRARTNS